jgi:hypothetical protein
LRLKTSFLLVRLTLAQLLLNILWLLVVQAVALRAVVGVAVVLLVDLEQQHHLQLLVELLTP